MIFKLELKATLSKDELSIFMGALSQIKKLPSNAYDIAVIPKAFIGITTGYDVVLKANSPEVIRLAVETISP